MTEPNNSESLTHLPGDITAQFFEVLKDLDREAKEKNKIVQWLRESERVMYEKKARATKLDGVMTSHLDKKTKRKIDKLLKESHEEEAALEEASKDDKKAVEKTTSELSKIAVQAPAVAPAKKNRRRKQQKPKRIPEE